MFLTTLHFTRKTGHLLFADADTWIRRRSFLQRIGMQNTGAAFFHV